MYIRISLGALFLTVLTALSGCSQQPTRRATDYGGGSAYTSTTREDMVSIDTMAARLGMRVDSVNSTHILLKNSNNTVMIFTHSGGQFYVNGRQAGQVGHVDVLSGKHYVPQSLAEQIRPLMRGGGIITSPSGSAWSGRLSGTVVIDPGHGGKDPGAISVKGFYEKTVNLSVARKLADRLRKRGLNVILTRNSDVFVELEQRAAIANQRKADLFVSIHADSSLTRTEKGYSVYVAKQASYGSQKVARAIAAQLHTLSPDGNGIKQADYRVLVKTKMPAVLVEMGYISNHGEAALISTDAFQNRIADAISAGICETISQI
ncbi:MAG: N-acetylmuramoyl-L-alanine amidase [Phycisphaerae bacterium]